MSILSTFKKYKDYILTENGYQLSSRWTKSDAVVMGDGTDDTNTLESNLGAIKGITSDLACEDTNVAASMSAVGTAITELNNNLIKTEILKQTITIPANGFGNFSFNIERAGYKLISTNISSAYNNVVPRFYSLSSGMLKNEATYEQTVELSLYCVWLKIS